MHSSLSALTAQGHSALQSKIKDLIYVFLPLFTGLSEKIKVDGRNSVVKSQNIWLQSRPTRKSLSFVRQPTMRKCVPTAPLQKGQGTETRFVWKPTLSDSLKKPNTHRNSFPVTVSKRETSELEFGITARAAMRHTASMSISTTIHHSQTQSQYAKPKSRAQAFLESLSHISRNLTSLTVKDKHIKDEKLADYGQYQSFIQPLQHSTSSASRSFSGSKSTRVSSSRLKRLTLGHKGL